jgi:hypothetical protein
MSWMKEIKILIEDAAVYGVDLEVGDFRVLNDRLIVDGMDADDWFRAMTDAVDGADLALDRLEDREL